MLIAFQYTLLLFDLVYHCFRLRKEEFAIQLNVQPISSFQWLFLPQTFAEPASSTDRAVFGFQWSGMLVCALRDPLRR